MNILQIGDVMTKIKICGIKNMNDVEIVNKYLPEYAGFILFYPKSHRNITIEKAKSLISSLDKRITPVAVVVKPDSEQLGIIAESGFSFVQIHGEVENGVIENSKLPVFKAFNVSDICDFEKYNSLDNVCGFVFDAGVPGSGKTFDWHIIDDLCIKDKVFILAGGLNPNNVKNAVELAKPDVVDVSSGVELWDKSGKDEEKVSQFIDNIRRFG